MTGNEIGVVTEKAKGYKRFFEKIEVNRNPVAINEKHYFEVLYTSRSGEVKGAAILSSGPENEIEAREAFPIVTLYNGLINSIFKAGAERAELSDDFYKEPLDLISQHDLPNLQPGKEIIKKMDNLLEQHKKYYVESIETFRAATVISQKDIEYAAKMAASIDLIHIEILKTVTEDLHVIENWISEMKSEGLWNELGENIKGFYEAANIRGSANIELLKTKRIPTSSTWDKQIEEMVQKGSVDLEKNLTQYKKDLRWPKPW